MLGLIEGAELKRVQVINPLKLEDYMSEPYEFVEIPTLEKEVDKLIPRSVRDAIMTEYPGHGGFSERLRDVCKFIRAKNATVKPRAGLIAYASGGNPSGALCVNTMVKYWSKVD